MLPDHRSFPSHSLMPCHMRDELTAEAAEIDAERDMEVYLGFAGDTVRQNGRPHAAHDHAEFEGGSLKRKARFKDQPVHSAVFGGADLPCVIDDAVDWYGDDVHSGSMRLKALHTRGLTPQPVPAGDSGLEDIEPAGQ